MAIKALIKVSISVSSKFNAAFAQHSKAKNIGMADQISDKAMRGIPGQAVDYLGLLAEWREFDICTNVAFVAIRAELAPDTVKGMDDYQIAMNKLAVRGETVVNALREAYEANSRYHLLIAQKQARDSAVAEVKAVQEGVRTAKTSESVAFMTIKHGLNNDLAQRSREAFVLMHEAILALLYQSNNVKLQKEEFAFLSPALDSQALDQQWAKLSKTVPRDEQSQDFSLTFDASVFATGWKDLLVKDKEAPFQIPVTHPKLKRQHRLRIQRIKVAFMDLERKQGSTKIDALEYTIALGPQMLDRARPRETSSSEEATVVQYYMPAINIQKQGERNELQNSMGNFAARSLCCGGKVFFDKEYVASEDWDLSTITDIKISVEYNCLTFQIG